mgnify:FL=1
MSRTILHRSTESLYRNNRSIHIKAELGLITAKTVQEYELAAVNTFGNREEDFLAAYPAADDSELKQVRNQLTIDNMNALQYMFAEHRSLSGHTDTYIFFKLIRCREPTEHRRFILQNYFFASLIGAFNLSRRQQVFYTAARTAILPRRGKD